jgi:hypothetical protein
MRNVALTFGDEFQDVVYNYPKQYHAAIGYLSVWAVGSRHKDVSIYGDNEGNLNAVYRNEAGEVTYTLFGQFNNGEYSFHS